MHMTRKIIEYIGEHAVSVEELARETGVELDVLNAAGRPLNATEFLKICHYLHLDPWCLYQQE